MTSPFERPGPGRLPPLPSSLRRVVLSIVALVFISLVIIPWLATFFTDWLWFKEIGFQTVFATSLIARIALFVIGGVFAFAWVYGNVRIARGAGTGFPVLYINRGDGVSVDITRTFTKLFFPAAVLIALVTAISLSASWQTVLKGLNAVQLGQRDPLFNRDISYYLFRLPLISDVLDTLITLTFLALIAVAAMYWLRNEITLPPRRSSAKPRASRHLGGLLAFLFLLIPIRLWTVGTADLLYSTTGPLVGASYTDVNVGLPGIHISAVAAIIAAVWVIYGVMRDKLIWSAVSGAIFYVVISVFARGVVPGVFQRLVVSPNELSRETPYLRSHINATRQAWGLDRVEARDLSGEVQLTMADIKANTATVDNVRLWERDLLMQTFKQLQEIRTYYDFVSVDDDRYVINGRYRQIHISARELNSASLPTRTFINERLTFTHGMGVTMAPVNQVTDEGLPVLFVKDLPPVSEVPSIKLTRPQIYYGELTDSYVFVGTRQPEFDYPAGDANIYTTYKGSGGVPVGSFWRKLLYAFQFGSMKILLSDDIVGDAKILYRRDIVERATTAMPFLDFDSDPYLMVNDAGQLKWILDAYTTSDAYPYSQRASNGTSYMRNSVKVVIDAYDGTVDAYIADPRDPVIRTYANIFSGIFKPIKQMPADVRRHLRYPGDLFRLQTALHATYHMTQPDAFYHREDQWQIPGSATGTNVNPFMRHIIMKLPGEKNPEFIFMTPFTPRGKDNLAAWMVARMDGENYGKLSVYRFPRQSLVYGPRQITNRINQDTEISRQLTLWDQRGSQVIRGELLVIPIEESLIYVQPIYLRAEGGNIPELKRVVVAHENRVVMGETLEEGLNALFGPGAATGQRQTLTSVEDSLKTLGAAQQSVVGAGGTTPTAPVPSGAVGELLRQAQTAYDRAIAAQRAGNWAEYGRQIDQLGAALRALRAGQH